MRKFRVTINGRNYLMDWEGERKRIGFFKIFFLEAEDPQAAENLAVAKIIADPKWEGTILNDESDPPMMYLDSLTELESTADVSAPETGYIFYPDEVTGGEPGSDGQSR
jgi:hypothetical protein